jgi:hypothetical protein
MSQTPFQTFFRGKIVSIDRNTYMEATKVLSHVKRIQALGVITLILSALFFSNTFFTERVFAEENTDATSTHATSSKVYNPYLSTDVEARVREYFADIPTMIPIAKCESTFRQYDSDGEVLDGGAGSMIGVFQINKRVHQGTALSLGLDIDTLEGNLAYARYLYEESGTDPWISCRNKEIDLDYDSILTTTFTDLPSIVSTLRLGTTNKEVLTLQKILNSTGFTIAESGPGSIGNETTRFGSLTRSAVQRFQCSQGIICEGDEETTGYGLVGTKTRKALLSLLATSKEETVALGKQDPSLE